MKMEMDDRWTFEEYWCKYGRHHAEACGSNSKLFAQEVWDGAIKAVLDTFLEVKEKEFLKTLGLEHDWVSPPGDTISDILKERGWKKAELAERLGVTEQYINEVLKGTASITPTLAQRLEHSFGAPAKFWLKREANYQKKIRGEK